MKKHVISLAVLCVLAAFVSACGGGSDEVDFHGSVRGVLLAGDANGVAVPGVTVCALGECSITDSDGNWEFEIDEDDFDGGAVLFVLTGGGVNDEVIVPGLDEEDDDIAIDFRVVGSEVVEVIVTGDEDTVDFD